NQLSKTLPPLLHGPIWPSVAIFKQSQTPSPPTSTSSTIPFPSLSMPSQISGVPPLPVVELPPLVRLTPPTLGVPPLGEPVVDAAPVLATMPVLAAALPSLAEPPSAAPPAGFSVASAPSDPEPQLASATIRNGKAGHKARLS